METVGEILRSQREKKGLSIKDIENGTSIRSLYIKAIEENDFDVIPGEVYLKGFIRNYASYLGVDTNHIMDVYRHSQNPVKQQEKAIEVKDVPQNDEERKVEPEKNSSRFILAGVLFLVLAGGAFWWFSSKETPKIPQTPVKEAKPAPSVPAPSQAETKPQPAAPPAVQNKPVVIAAKFTANCWTLVTADGKEVYEGTAKAGDSLSWEAEKKIIVKAGNAGAVEITFNGQNMGKLGEIGEVVEKAFSPK